jgi:hypothetical protein
MRSFFTGRISTFPFVTHNADLLEMLDSQLGEVLAGRKTGAKVGDQAKWILNACWPATADIFVVARKLGVSGRVAAQDHR